MSLSGSKLSDLPLHLQCKILSYLAPSSGRSIEPSLTTVNKLRKELPTDLLAIANTSRGLREATIEVLAVQGQILNTAIARPIWHWIPALNNTVKAVSLLSEYRLATQMKEGNAVRDGCVLLYASCLNTLRALCAHNVRLQVLDVTAAPFHDYTDSTTIAKKLYCGLKYLLITSASSLRELAIGATPISVNALSRVTLPNLQVVRLTMRRIDCQAMKKFDKSSPKKKAKSENAYMHALRALDGHADRIANKTTLRELCLMNFEDPPCVYNDNTCKSLFASVQVLRFGAYECERDRDIGFAKFIALFSNLRSLHWHGSAMAPNLPMIFAWCPMLEELHSSHIRGLILSDWIKWPGPNFHTFRDVCHTYRGKLRNFRVHSTLTTEQLQILGESCPGLERLETHVSRENMAGLSCLLGKNCRQLKKLEICVPAGVNEDDFNHGDYYETLGTDGWRELSESIQSASDELCGLSVRVIEFPYEHIYDAMLQFALDVIEFLGERALEFRLEMPICVCLEVPIHTYYFATLGEPLCRIINKCVDHSKMLRILKLHLGSTPLNTLNEEREAFWWENFHNAMKKLEKLPHLHTIEIDIKRLD